MQKLYTRNQFRKVHAFNEAILNICDYFEITPAEFFDERTDASLQYYQVVNKMRALDNAELEAISNLVEQILLLKSENERLKMNIDKDIPQLIQK